VLLAWTALVVVAAALVDRRRELVRPSHRGDGPADLVRRAVVSARSSERDRRYGCRSPVTTFSEDTSLIVLANEFAGLNAFGIGLTEGSMPFSRTSAAV
jgi:hypothetical protein